MSPFNTLWLVRKRDGTIIGPYPESQLLSDLSRGIVRIEDEVAPSGGGWRAVSELSLDSLREERTQSTRSSTTSQASVTESGSRTVSIDTGNAAPKIDVRSVEVRRPKLHSVPHTDPPKSKAKPLLKALSATTLFAIAAYFLFRQDVGTTVVSPPKEELYMSHEMSEVEKEAYALIQVGERRAALDRLRIFHESAPASSEKGYLIPYAGLMITENDSSTRSNALLTSVLGSQADDTLKSQAHHWLGYSDLAKNAEGLGQDHFLDAIQLNPKHTAAKFNMGRALLASKKMGEALEYFKLAELDAPEFWAIHIYKGHARVEMNKNSDAAQDFQRAVILAPDRWIVHLYQAIFFKANMQEDKALAALRNMLTRDPDYETSDPPPFGYFVDREQYSDYWAAFSRVVDSQKSPELFEIGKRYLSYLQEGPTGRTAQLIVNSNHQDLISKVIRLKVGLESEVAQPMLKDFVENLPENMEEFGSYAYILRADGFHKLGDLLKAEQDYKRAVLLEPKSAIARMKNANFFKATGKVKESQRELELLRSYHPNYIPAILTAFEK